MYEYKISVIVPTFNSSSTIERLVHSLASQDFRDFEIVFIDDASEDNTIETIQNAIKDKKLSYQILSNKENRGPGYSRNVGIRHSKGRYIVFIDSDDIVNYNHLSSLYKNVNGNNVESAFIKGVKLDYEGELFDFQVDRFDSLLRIAKESKGIVKAEDIIRLELEMKMPFSFVLLIYDKEIILENELKFNEEYRYGEDTTFALKYLSNCDNVRVIDRYTYFYYQNQESITRTSSFNRFESIKLFEELTLYFNIVSDKKAGFKELNSKLVHSRIPRFIFGNMNYFFYNDYSKDYVFRKMGELDLFDKLKQFKIYEKRDIKFYLKTRLFLLNPDLYYSIWKKMKKEI